MEDNGNHRLFDNHHSSKYLIHEETHKNLEQLKFGTTSKWQNLDFWVNYPFKKF